MTGSVRGDQDQFFFRTRDGGKTWQQQPFAPPEGFFRGYARFQTPQFFGEKKMEGVVTVHFVQHDPERSEVVIYGTKDGSRGANRPPTGTMPTCFNHSWTRSTDSCWSTTNSSARKTAARHGQRLGPTGP